ncbi:hypothetical protein EON65_33750 [archaeon]|nr:MAG: hypothetical protein EON65_33750 [archaeon]
MYRLVVSLCLIALSWSSVDRTWVCFVYHKSGTELCDKTMFALAERCSLKLFEPKASEVIDEAFNRFSSPSNDYHLIRTGLNTTGFLNYRWLRSFASAGDRYRSILFLRDPFELIMSAYKYHSEEVPVEEWLTTSNALIGFSLDHLLPMARERYEPILRCAGYSVKEFIDTVRRIHDECHKALDIFGGKYSFHHMLAVSRHFSSLPVHHSNFSHLNSAALASYLSRLPKVNHNISMYGNDLYPSIRLQMCQSVYQLESMAISKLFEDPAYSLTVHLEDFGMGNLTQFRKAARNMAKFVLGKNANWGKCSNASYFVDIMEENVFIESKHLTSKSNHLAHRRSLAAARVHRKPDLLHITTYLMPHATQEMYKQRIRLDPVFGDYLTRLASIINQPTDRDHGLLIDNCPALTEQVDWIDLQKKVNIPL